MLDQSIKDKIKENNLYGADLSQTFEFEVKHDGWKYDTAHHYLPLTDERYLEFINALKVRVGDSAVENNAIEATESLWNDLVNAVENIETDETEDWKALIDYQEKEDSLNSFLAVAIVEPEGKASGIRRLSQQQQEKVFTEAFHSGVPVSQTHILQKKTDEWRRKYNRIQAKRYKQEQTKGLSRKAEIEYVPQDAAIGALYDEMVIETQGFVENVVPLRFKTKVVHYLFESKTDEKK